MSVSVTGVSGDIRLGGRRVTPDEVRSSACCLPF